MIDEKRKATSWVMAVEPTTNKLKLGFMFGGGVHFNTKGCEAVYQIITDMAKRLDTAAEYKNQIDRDVSALSVRLAKAEAKLISHEVKRIAGVTSKVTAREVFLHIAYWTVIIWLTTS